MPIPTDLEWRISPWSQACDMYRTQIDVMINHAQRQMNMIAEEGIKEDPLLEEAHNMLLELIIPELLCLKSNMLFLSEKYQAVIQKNHIEISKT